jgi:hypothetical protein
VQDRLDQFLGLSVELTGLSRLQLLGTAMADAYLETMDAKLPAGGLDELLAAYGQLPAGAAREAAITTELLDNSDLGPMTRDLILLWYCGSWGGDIVSAEAYLAGLQWVAAGAHPPGAQQQGFGAWSQPPESSRL